MRAIVSHTAQSEYRSIHLIQRALGARFSLAVFAFCLIVFSAALSQTRPSSPPRSSPLNSMASMSLMGEGPTLTLSLYDENHALLDQQAVVKLTNKTTQSVFWQTTQSRSAATFTNLKGAEYELEVSAAGYVPGRQAVSLLDEDRSRPLEVVLRADPDSPDRRPQQGQPLPGKVRKNLARGVEELKAGRLAESQKKLTAAYKKAPSNAEVNYLLGALYFQKKDFAHAEAYLAAAVNLDPQNLQARILLGRLQLQDKRYEAARLTLEQAVTVNPESWMARSLLADVYLKQEQPEKAKQQAELAMEKSHGADNSAQLVLAEALAHLGKKQEAIQALRAYIQSEPANRTVPEVQKLVQDLEKPESESVATSASSTNPIELSGMDQLIAATTPKPSLGNWQPGGIDDHKPAVTAGVSCPAEAVIDGAGKRVKELVDGLARFDAIESMLHEDLDELGLPKSKVSLKFDYVASISEKKPGILLVDEFRNWHSQAEDFPDHIATRGLPALAFVFHPSVRGNFEMNCEGLGTWDGASTWLVRFQQREDKPHNTQEYVVNGKVYHVSVKGRAWIAADTYQIVRLESDLVRPIPEIQLFSQHWTVDYGPVKFPRQNEELWLPKNAELYFDFLKHRYFRRHSFDHFMLFSVDTEEKRKEPKVEPEPDQDTKHRPRGLGTIVIAEFPGSAGPRP